jgi:hypothetical protein
MWLTVETGSGLSRTSPLFSLFHPVRVSPRMMEQATGDLLCLPWSACEGHHPKAGSRSGQVGAVGNVARKPGTHGDVTLKSVNGI